MSQEKEQNNKTIEELGANMPIGIQDINGSTLHKAFKVKPWRMKEEMRLAEIKEENKNSNLAQYIAMVLSEMCESIGPYDFSDMSFDEKRLKINQMYSGDVFYIYIWLRMQALGSELELTHTCNSCQKQQDILADLGSTETKIVETTESLPFEYELTTPVEIRGKETKKLFLNQTKWAMMEGLLNIDKLTTAQMKSGVMTGSIVGIDSFEHDISLSENDLMDLTKRDIELLTSCIDKKSIGPNMSIEGTCGIGSCKAKYLIPIDWTYDNFFSISSQ